MTETRYAAVMAAALLAMLASAPAVASNYGYGGPLQTYYFVPNWGANSRTITAFPSLETITTLSAGAEGSKPAHIVPDPKGEYIFSINHGGNELSVFDAKSGVFVKHIVTGSEESQKGQGHQYYWSPDGDYLYVAELDDGAVVEVDARQLEVRRRAAYVAAYPFGMVPAWDHGHLYVLSQGPSAEEPGNGVTQFDIETFQPIKTIKVGKAPHAGAYTNGKVYVGNIAKGEQSVSVIDAKRGEVVQTIQVGWEDPHFLEESGSGNHLLAVASKLVAELVIIDDRSDEIVGRFTATDPDLGKSAGRHPLWHPSGESLYYPIGFADGTSRIYQVSVPGMDVVSKSEPTPSRIHVLQWNNTHERIYASTEGDHERGIPPGVSVFKARADGSVKKLADMFSDTPEGEDLKGHHGSLN